MAETTFEGRTLHYVDQGSGPAVLLLHAFPLSSEMWREQIGALTGGGFRCLALDFPGFGRSAPAVGPASMDLYARAALAVLDAGEVARAAVVGLSLGGYVAFALHARAPERIAALALCDTRAGADSEDGKKGREATARAVEADGSRLLAERMLPNLLSPSAPPAVRQAVEGLILRTPPSGAAAALRAMAARPDSTGRLGQIACPTLVLVGAADALTPPAESQQMAGRIPTAAECEVLGGAGHLANLERPEEFNEALLNFLRQWF